jgi:hypothetical protein
LGPYIISQTEFALLNSCSYNLRLGALNDKQTAANRRQFVRSITSSKVESILSENVDKKSAMSRPNRRMNVSIILRMLDSYHFYRHAAKLHGQSCRHTYFTLVVSLESFQLHAFALRALPYIDTLSVTVKERSHTALETTSNQINRTLYAWF